MRQEEFLHPLIFNNMDVSEEEVQKLFQLVDKETSKEILEKLATQLEQAESKLKSTLNDKKASSTDEDKMRELISKSTLISFRDSLVCSSNKSYSDF